MTYTAEKLIRILLMHSSGQLRKLLKPVLGVILISLPGICLAGDDMTTDALEDDQLQAEILEVDEANNALKVRVIKSGNPLMAREGAVYEFGTSDDLNVEIPSAGESLVVPVNPTLGDLKEGDTVRLDLAESGTAVIIIGILGEPEV